MVRTTLTLDNQLVTELKRISAESGRSFKDVVNETIRAGLIARERPPSAPYRLRPSSLGALRVAGSLEKALRLADELEDSALLDKLEQRK